jgi:benzoylformate decarboxylase
MHDYLPILERDTFYTCASGGLGHGLPAAVGVAMARPKDKVIALLGDGSAMFAIQGLWSAVNQNLPITFIIINNASYAALKMFGRIFDLDEVVGSNLGGIDFVSVGQGMGCDGARVDNPQDLDEAISTAINASGPYVLEVVVES